MLIASCDVVRYSMHMIWFTRPPNLMHNFLLIPFKRLISVENSFANIISFYEIICGQNAKLGGYKKQSVDEVCSRRESRYHLNIISNCR